MIDEGSESRNFQGMEYHWGGRWAGQHNGLSYNILWDLAPSKFLFCRNIVCSSRSAGRQNDHVKNILWRQVPQHVFDVSICGGRSAGHKKDNEKKGMSGNRQFFQRLPYLFWGSIMHSVFISKVIEAQDDGTDVSVGDGMTRASTPFPIWSNSSGRRPQISFAEQHHVGNEYFRKIFFVDERIKSLVETIL